MVGDTAAYLRGEALQAQAVKFGLLQCGDGFYQRIAVSVGVCFDKGLLLPDVANEIIRIIKENHPADRYAAWLD